MESGVRRTRKGTWMCLQITQELFMQVRETYVKAATDQQEETDECNSTFTARSQSLSEIMNF